MRAANVPGVQAGMPGIRAVHCAGPTVTGADLPIVTRAIDPDISLEDRVRPGAAAGEGLRRHIGILRIAAGGRNALPVVLITASALDRQECIRCAVSDVC